MLTSLIFAAMLLAADDKDAKELAKLQGDWEIQASEHKGFVIPSSRPVVWTFKGSEYTWIQLTDGSIGKTEFRIDASKDPMHIDLVGKSGKATPTLAIFKIEGDLLTICNGTRDKRPTEFKTMRTNENLITVHKRVKK